MPYINLIQEQRQEARKNESRARMFFLSFVGSLVMGAGVFGFLMFDQELLKMEEAQLRQKAQKLQPLANRIDSNLAEYADLQPRLTTLENANLATGHWSRILDHISKTTPQSTWLTGVRCNSPDPTKPIEVIFAGLSDRQELVGDFMLSLQSCADIANVHLNFTREQVAAYGRNIAFEIATEIEGSAETKPDIKKEGSDEKATQS